jgi:hypothetical protein
MWSPQEDLVFRRHYKPGARASELLHLFPGKSPTEVAARMQRAHYAEEMADEEETMSEGGSFISSESSEDESPPLSEEARRRVRSMLCVAQPAPLQAFVAPPPMPKGDLAGWFHCDHAGCKRPYPKDDFSAKMINTYPRCCLRHSSFDLGAAAVFYNTDPPPAEEWLYDDDE